MVQIKKIDKKAAVEAIKATLPHVGAARIPAIAVQAGSTEEVKATWCVVTYRETNSIFVLIKTGWQFRGRVMTSNLDEKAVPPPKADGSTKKPHVRVHVLHAEQPSSRRGGCQRTSESASEGYNTVLTEQVLLLHPRLRLEDPSSECEFTQDSSKTVAEVLSLLAVARNSTTSPPTATEDSQETNTDVQVHGTS